MKFKNCLVWAIKAKYFHTVLKLINVERLFENSGSCCPISNIKLQQRCLGSHALTRNNAELSVITFNTIYHALFCLAGIL